MKATYTTILPLALLFTLTGCQSGGGNQSFSGLKKFESCEELNQYIKNSPTEFASIDMRNSQAGEMAAADRDLAEGDLVVSHNDLLIQASGNKLHFIRNSASGLDLIRTDSLDESSSYLQIIKVQNYLLVSSQSIASTALVEGGFAKPEIILAAYDLQNPSLNKISETLVEGYFEGLRLSKSGSAAKLLVRTYISNDAEHYAPAADQLPGVQTEISASSRSATNKICKCEDIHYIPRKEEVGAYSLLSFQNVEIQSGKIILQENFSLMDVFPVIRSTEDSYLLASELAGAYDHTALEKENSLNGVRQSLLIRLKETENDLQPVAYGFVPGAVQEASNMRANNDTVHVFSVVRDWHMITDRSFDQMSRDIVNIDDQPIRFSIDPIETRLNTFRQDEKNLSLVHEIKGLGKNQSLYATRFIEDRAYAITASSGDFTSTTCGLIFPNDPYMIFDLSTPKTPALKGSLEIDGYTRQLLPLDNGTVLGVGREVDGSVQASLFSGSSAILHDREILSNSLTLSPTAGDAGAFSVGDESYKTYAFDSEEGILAFPMSRRSSCEDLEFDHEVQVIQANINAIESLGRISGFTNFVNRILLTDDAIIGFSDAEVIKASRANPTIELDRIQFPN